MTQEFHFKGIGLHSGKTVSCKVRPHAITADTRPDTRRGIHFIHEPSATRLPLRPDMIVETTLSTVIGIDDNRISTIEHLLAAMRAQNIWHADIFVDGNEIPIMDGSSTPFIEGLPSLDHEAPQIHIPYDIKIADGASFIHAIPNHEQDIHCMIDFADPAIGKQALSWAANNDPRGTAYSHARTFCMAKDVEIMQAAGIALGGSLDNAVVIDQGKVLNQDGFRHDHECVQHKLLDLIGDMMQLGGILNAKITANRPSHRINNLFCQAVLESISTSRAA